MRTVHVWDLPLRVFHWSLLVLVVGSAVTGLAGGNWMTWHGRLGVALTGLLAFRLAWGLVGSTHSRFASFVRGPVAVVAYLRGEWRAPPVGHSPLGALAVLALLAMLGFQIATGLVANDDIAFNGPLYALVSKETSDWSASLHRRSIWLFGALIALHLAAIVFYLRFRNRNLVLPMLTGRARHDDVESLHVRGGGWAALVLSLAVGAVAVWLAGGGLVPESAVEPPATAAPNW